jgi:homoserine dehydrogenase
MRVWLVGTGTVGRWLLRALHEQSGRLRERYGVAPTVVGLANARNGFVYDARGIDPGGLGERPLTELPGARHWPTALEGMRATEADVLVEVTASPRAGGEPGVAHMREALARGIHVVTSNKWPVALCGVQLSELARVNGVQLRAESTVMSGTPLLRGLTEGLAGATPLDLRGLLNATVNQILTRMNAGASYDDALAEAQAAGLAERDPSADVDGDDSVAKLLILAALVFRRQLRPDQVACRGIVGLDPAELERDGMLRHLATLDFSAPDGRGDVQAEVRPALLPLDDPLARVDGTANAVILRAEPVGEVTITGPGAGPKLAGQGVLSDLISVCRTGTSPTVG